MMSANDIIKIINGLSDQLGVDENLVCAIASVESQYYPLAIRFEPKWAYFTQPEVWAYRNACSLETEKMLQACSFGVLQCMGTVARELGHNGHLLELIKYPELAIKFGIKKILKLQERYEDEKAVIAAYNAGSPRKIIGPNGTGYVYVNQEYVNKVTAALTRLRQF